MKKIILVAMVMALGVVLSFPQNVVSKDDSNEVKQLSFTMWQITVMSDMIVEGGHSISGIAKTVGVSQKDVYTFWKDMYLRGVRSGIKSNTPPPLPVEYKVRVS